MPVRRDRSVHHLNRRDAVAGHRADPFRVGSASSRAMPTPPRRTRHLPGTHSRRSGARSHCSPVTGCSLRCAPLDMRCGGMTMLSAAGSPQSALPVGQPCDCGDQDAAVRSLGDSANTAGWPVIGQAAAGPGDAVTVSVSRPSSGEPIAQRLNAIQHLYSCCFLLLLVSSAAGPGHARPGCGRVAGRGQPRPKLLLVADASTPPPPRLRLMHL
jgi:hypothetical protein